MGAAQAGNSQQEAQEFFGDVESGEEEPGAPWMNNPVVVSNIDDNSLQKFIDDNERVMLVFVESMEPNNSTILITTTHVLCRQHRRVLGAVRGPVAAVRGPRGIRQGRSEERAPDDGVLQHQRSARHQVLQVRAT